MTIQSFEEKRQYPRINLSILTSFNFVDKKENEQKRGVARTLNVSRSGILLSSGCPFTINSKLEITLILKDKFLTLDGEVKRIERDSSGNYIPGINFFNMASEAQKSLLTFLTTEEVDFPSN